MGVDRYGGRQQKSTTEGHALGQEHVHDFWKITKVKQTQMLAYLPTTYECQITLTRRQNMNVQHMSRYEN